METKTMGQTISALRKERGMTQRDLAEKLGITDKAVSKWERDLACPDISLLPKLAQILEISVDELMHTGTVPKPRNNTAQIVDLVLKAVPLAMGVAVTVLTVLDELPVQSGFTMLGIGLACVGTYLMKEKTEPPAASNG